MILTIKPRRLLYWGLCLLLGAALCVQCFLLGDNLVATFSPITDWGLTFGEAGTQPRGNLDAATLAQYNAYYIGNSADKVLYLTFDAGYENGYTATILDTLKKHNVPAAFFLVGHYVTQNPGLVCRMVEEGHLVGNHTYHHPDMKKLTDKSTFETELRSLEAAFSQATGGKSLSSYYRPPQGQFNDTNLTLAKEMGYATVFWSLAYADWDPKDQPTRDYALGKLMPRTHNGAVILLHTTSATNATILDELITTWQAQGYRFGTLEELRQSQTKP